MLIKELKRRNVFKVASVYLITSWLILQIIAVITPALHLPTLFSTITLIVLAMGFPVACIFAWAFELTPEGLKRTHEVDEHESIRHHTGAKINYLTASALVMALAFISYDKWFIASANDNFERSIAVLPFEDMSQDNSQGYFGDGIAEEILNSLARLNQLIVIARTSSFNFKDSNIDIREIGKILNVNYVLEGSVRKDKDKVRITAQLIEVKSGAHIWSQTYDRQLTSIFAVQDELTFAITQALKLNLLPEQVEHEAGMTTNPEAYELFIQGRELAYQRTSESLQQAAKLLNQAIELDEQFYLAKAQLYMAYDLAIEYGGFTAENIKAQTEHLFWQLMVAPDFALKNLVLANHAENNYKLPVKEVQALYEKAYQQAPNDPLVQNLYILNLTNTAKQIEIRTKVLKTNPESQINYSNLLYLYIISERLSEAEKLYTVINNKFIDSTPSFIANLYWLYSHQQNIDNTLAFINSYQGKKEPSIKSFTMSINILVGNVEQTLSELPEVLTQFPDSAVQFFSPLYHLFALNYKNKLTSEQSQQLKKLPINSTFKMEIEDTVALTQGNAQTYIEHNQLTDISSEEFLKKVDTNSITPFLFAAILKHQGNNQYAKALLPVWASTLTTCKETKAAEWFCLLLLYLDDSYSQEQLFSLFQRSLLMLNPSAVGVEMDILTSPIYYGVNQHPEFKQVANEFLDRTFRKWNPDLVTQ